MNVEKLESLKAKLRSPFMNDQLCQIEVLIKGSLPTAYRNFLSTYGGASFDSVYYDDNGVSVQFGWFFDFEELCSALDSYSDSIPGNMIPVGEDGGGNLYCLGIRGSVLGRLYFHDHSIGWDTEEDRQETVYKIANSLDAFINGMFICE